MMEIYNPQLLNQKLFEREQLIYQARDFLNTRKDENGTISQKEADYFEENFVRGKEELDRLIDNEMNKLTRKPILENPLNNIGGVFGAVETCAYKGVSGADYRKNFFNEIRHNFRTAYNTLQESTTDKGGFLVPSEWHTELISELKNEIQVASPTGNDDAPDSKENDDSWTCDSCQAVNNGKFCTNCGSPKPDNGTWVCPNCSSENSGNFCSNCGTPKP